MADIAQLDQLLG